MPSPTAAGTQEPAFIRQAPMLCRGHSRPVVDLSYSPVTDDGYFVISACLDGKPMLRHGETGDWIGTFEGHKGAVWSASMDKPALRAVTGSADFTAKLWDAVTGDEIQSFTHAHIVKTARFNDEGTSILTGCNDKILRVFDLGNPEADPLKMLGHDQPIKVALYTPDPNIVVSGAQDKTVRLWDIRTLSVVGSLDISAKAAISSMDLGGKGNTLTVTAGKEVSFWDARKHTQLKAYSFSYEVESACLAPDEQRFVVGGGDNWVHVYDYATGAQLEYHKGHTGPVHVVRYTPDGAMYASGSGDGTVRIWRAEIPPEFIAQTKDA